MQCFQNALAYFVVAVTYVHKMFMKFKPYAKMYQLWLLTDVYFMSLLQFQKSLLVRCLFEMHGIFFTVLINYSPGCVSVGGGKETIKFFKIKFTK